MIDNAPRLPNNAEFPLYNNIFLVIKSAKWGRKCAAESKCGAKRDRKGAAVANSNMWLKGAKMRKKGDKRVQKNGVTQATTKPL